MLLVPLSSLATSGACTSIVAVALALVAVARPAAALPSGPAALFGTYNPPELLSNLSTTDLTSFHRHSRDSSPELSRRSSKRPKVARDAPARLATPPPPPAARVAAPAGRGAHACGSSFALAQTYAGASFLDGFDFFVGPDPTHGQVAYASQAEAARKGLAYTDPNGATVLRADGWTCLALGQARDSVRVESRRAIVIGSLVVLDASKVGLEFLLLLCASHSLRGWANRLVADGGGLWFVFLSGADSVRAERVGRVLDGRTGLAQRGRNRHPRGRSRVSPCSLNTVRWTRSRVTHQPASAVFLQQHAEPGDAPHLPRLHPLLAHARDRQSPQHRVSAHHLSPSISVFLQSAAESPPPVPPPRLPSCNVYANGNTGCGVQDPSPASYGPGFAAAGGGVSAMHWDATGISIWSFQVGGLGFPRCARDVDQYAADSASSRPPALGHPAQPRRRHARPVDLARARGSVDAAGCSMAQFFGPQKIIFDITVSSTASPPPAAPTARPPASQTSPTLIERLAAAPPLDRCAATGLARRTAARGLAERAATPSWTRPTLSMPRSWSTALKCTSRRLERPGGGGGGSGGRGL